MRILLTNRIKQGNEADLVHNGGPTCERLTGRKRHAHGYSDRHTADVFAFPSSTPTPATSELLETNFKTEKAGVKVLGRGRLIAGGPGRPLIRRAAKALWRPRGLGYYRRCFFELSTSHFDLYVVLCLVRATTPGSRTPCALGHRNCSRYPGITIQLSIRSTAKN